MTGIDHERLVLFHDRQVVHYQPKLHPVGEHLAIASVRHQLMRKLERRNKERPKRLAILTQLSYYMVTRLYLINT